MTDCNGQNASVPQLCISPSGSLLGFLRPHGQGRRNGKGARPLPPYRDAGHTGGAPARVPRVPANDNSVAGTERRSAGKEASPDQPRRVPALLAVDYPRRHARAASASVGKCPCHSWRPPTAPCASGGGRSWFVHSSNKPSLDCNIEHAFATCRLGDGCSEHHRPIRRGLCSVVGSNQGAGGRGAAGPASRSLAREITVIACD